MDYQLKESLKEKAEMVKMISESVKNLSECGFAISPQWIAESFKIPIDKI